MTKINMFARADKTCSIFLSASKPTDCCVHVHQNTLPHCCCRAAVILILVRFTLPSGITRPPMPDEAAPPRKGRLFHGDIALLAAGSPLTEAAGVGAAVPGGEDCDIFLLSTRTCCSYLRSLRSRATKKNTANKHENEPPAVRGAEEAFTKAGLQQSWVCRLGTHRLPQDKDTKEIRIEISQLLRSTAPGIFRSPDYLLVWLLPVCTQKSRLSRMLYQVRVGFLRRR